MLCMQSVQPSSITSTTAQLTMLLVDRSDALKYVVTFDSYAPRLQDLLSAALYREVTVTDRWSVDTFDAIDKLS